jgi:cytoskeletal protein RodZ
MPHHQTAPPSSRSQRELNLEVLRKRAGVSLDQIANATKISLRFLKAIEAEEYDKLPGGIFTTSYLRQYALAIGYDEDALLAHHSRKTNPQSGNTPPRKEAARSWRLDRWLKPAQASR